MQLIDRDALNKEFRDFVRASNNSDFEPTPNWNDAVSLVGSAPTVDAEPVRHGHWIWKERKGIREAWYQCSECNAYDLREIDVTSHYCWACGAKMDGERKDDGDC